MENILNKQESFTNLVSLSETELMDTNGGLVFSITVGMIIKTGIIATKAAKGKAIIATIRTVAGFADVMLVGGMVTQIIRRW